MRTINKNSDLKFCLDDYPQIGQKFEIKFYTTDKNFCITKNQNDITIEDDKKYLKINWSELNLIGDGVLQFDAKTAFNDSDFDDGEYNTSLTVTTTYFIVGAVDVPSDGKEKDNIITILTAQKKEIESLNTKIDDVKNKNYMTEEHFGDLWGNEIDMVNGDILEAYKKSDKNKKSISDNEAVTAKALTDLMIKIQNNEMVTAMALTKLNADINNIKNKLI